jgi:hypothetical protein
MPPTGAPRPGYGSDPHAAYRPPALTPSWGAAEGSGAPNPFRRRPSPAALIAQIGLVAVVMIALLVAGCLFLRSR